MSEITNRSTPIIPPNLISRAPSTWKRADVLAFLQANQELYDLDPEHINSIRDNEVSGVDFLGLTRERLMGTAYGLRDGPASRILLIIRDLPLIAKPPPPQQVQKEPPQEPLLESRSFRVNSGTMSHSCSQRHQDLDRYISQELRGNTKVDVGGFDNIFDLSLDSVDLPNLGLSDWLQIHEGQAFESYGVNLFKEFSDHESAQSSGRCFRGSGNKPLKDAKHGCNRKPDIFLLPTNSTNNSWKHVLVVGEFKCTPTSDKNKDTIKQLAGYIREIFGAQPGRRFVYAFTVCGHISRLWLFDRAGVSASKISDISTDEGSKSFRRALLGFMRMSESDLGIGDSSFLTVQGQKYQLLEVIHHSPSIVSRGTVCWKALRCDDEILCVVKECWRDVSLSPEFEFWKRANANKVVGCLDILASSDQEYAFEGLGVENNIRKELDFGGAQIILEDRSANSVTKQYMQADSEPLVIPSSKKRQSTTKHSGSCKRVKNKDVRVQARQARVRNLMVMSNVGQRLETITCPRVLLEVLRDAIECHQSLYEKGNILHCDISNNNILVNTDTSSRKGFLIDLDNARFLSTSDKTSEHPSPTLISLDPKVITGTPPFMALELLFDRPITQTWRHDLESFFYVLIWVCIQNPFVTLKLWREGLLSPFAARAKRDDLSNGFEVVILQQFKPEFEKVKPVVTKLRNILFYNDDADQKKPAMDYTTPSDVSARKEMYDKFIRAFNDELA